MWIWLGVIALTVILDQISKVLAVTYLMGEPPVSVIPYLLRFTYVENDGAAFGMLDDRRWVFMIISSIAIVGLLIYLWRFAPDSPWVRCGLSLIIGGGVGNMIDRVRLGYVVDFIDFYTIWQFVFNLADSFVCVGAAILFVWCLWAMIQEYREEKKKKGQTETSSEDRSDKQA